MPERCKRCDKRRPAGPAPTIATWVSKMRSALSRASERIGGELGANGDPLHFGESVEVGLWPAESAPAARGKHAAEGIDDLVDQRLVVDVDDAARNLRGDVEPLHH